MAPAPNLARQGYRHQPAFRYPEAQAVNDGPIHKTKGYRCIMCHTLVTVPAEEHDEYVICPGCGRRVPSGVYQLEEINGLCERCKLPIDDCKC